jgi:hypothetical protein
MKDVFMCLHVKSGSCLDLIHTSPVKVLGRRAEKTGSPAIGQPIFNIRREYYITLNCPDFSVHSN